MALGVTSYFLLRNNGGKNSNSVRTDRNNSSSAVTPKVDGLTNSPGSCNNCDKDLLLSNISESRSQFGKDIIDLDSPPPVVPGLGSVPERESRTEPNKGVHNPLLDEIKNINDIESMKRVLNGKGYVVIYEKLLGKGASSVVFECKKADSEECVAVKVCIPGKNALAQLADELAADNLLKKKGVADCEYLIVPSLMETFPADAKNEDKEYAIFEARLAEMDARTYFRTCASKVHNEHKNDKDWLPSANYHELKRVARHILMGLKVLHDKDIVHRDIKANNILVTKRSDGHGRTENMYSLTDFGTALFSPWNEDKNEDIGLVGDTLFDLWGFYLDCKATRYSREFGGYLRDGDLDKSFFVRRFGEEFKSCETQGEAAEFIAFVKKLSAKKLTVDEALKDPYLTSAVTESVSAED